MNLSHRISACYILVQSLNPLPPNDVYIYVYIYLYMSYRTANFQTLHFKYLYNKHPY
jgi:hypothetical protein